MNEFISVFQARQDVLLEKIWEHIQISVLSLLIAIIIAVPLGLLLTRYKKLAEPVIGLTAVLQTIPSLAVLAFLIPFFGIGQKPAIIALTAYALLPILRNTYTGVKEIDPALKEAATGLGMNSFKRLTKVELPLAMPVIMAGIRTSMVLIVGTATIAALIGAGGLGDLILLGLDRGANLYLIILGALPAALLAILLDVVLRQFERTSAKTGFKSLITIMIIAFLIVTVPYFIPDKQKQQGEHLVFAGKLGSEPEILINMYKLLIEDETDMTVELKPGLGKTAFVFEALQKGDIDLYPEYTGTAIVTHLNEQAVSNNAREVYEQAKQGMLDKYYMAFLEPMKFNNTYAVATTQKLAKANHLETIGDLKKIQNNIVAGFTLEFKDREDGYKGMQKLYDLNLNVKTMEPGVRQKAIENGDVDVIDAYATSGYMTKLKLKVLADPKNLFPPYQGAPLLRQETLDENPEIAEILNQLGGKISDEEMQNMNYQVSYEDKDAKTVARDYLQKIGLLK